MAYDPAAFREVYLGGQPFPIALTGGWAIASIAPDRTRHAIDLFLESPSGRLTVFVEPRVEGGACFAATRHLMVSYYEDADVTDAEAGRVVRALVERLQGAETGMADAQAARVFGAIAARDASGQARTLEVRINRECNERCLFCNTPASSETILPGRSQVLDVIRRGRESGFADLTVTGREPTLDPALPDYLAAARDLGYRVIRVQTNGTALAQPGVIERLVDSGMTCAEVSLHTLRPATFDLLVGEPRLLDKTWAGLVRLGAFPAVHVHLVVVLTRLNAAEVPELVDRVTRELPHVHEMTFSPVAPVGDGAGHVDLLASFAELRDPLGRALRAATGAGLRAHVPSRCGMPLCAMPEGTAHLNDEADNPPGQRPGAGKVRPGVCDPCAHRDRCTGVWAAHLRAHGEGELRPLADPVQS